jgi:hypothetical protein
MEAWSPSNSSWEAKEIALCTHKTVDQQEKLPMLRFPLNQGIPKPRRFAVASAFTRLQAGRRRGEKGPFPVC